MSTTGLRGFRRGAPFGRYGTPALKGPAVGTEEHCVRFMDTTERDQWVAQMTGVSEAAVATVFGVEHEVMVGVGIIDDPGHIFVFFDRAALAAMPRSSMDMDMVARKAAEVSGCSVDLVSLVLHLELHLVDPEAAAEESWPDCPAC